MEGKEVRFGVAMSSLFATITTDASCGAVNAMHDSLTPLGGLIPIINIELGEIVFGGVGSGLYGMLLWAVVAMFVAGLMVGRTPEYLGKKIEAKEVKMSMLAILVLAFSILGFTALASVTQGGSGRAAQQRAARLQRDPLRLHFGDRQQWQRLCRPHRQHGLLQHHPRLRDADRPLPLHRADDGGGGLAGGQEDRACHRPAPSPPMAACSSAFSPA